MEKSFLNMTIGERIICLFDDTAYSTQEKIGQLLGVSQDTVSMWKKGRQPSSQVLEEITKITSVDYNWLIDGKTSSASSLAYVFYPKLQGFGDGYDFKLKEPYERARYFLGYALTHNHNKEETDLALKAVAAFTQHSVEPESIHPHPIAIEEPDELGFLEHISTLKIKKNYISAANNNFKILLKCYTAPNQIINKASLRNQHTGRYINDNLKKTHKDFYEIPYFPDGIAAGNPKEIKEHPDGVVILHKDWCSHPRETSAAKLAATAHSMEPTIMSGSIVTVDHSFTDPKDLIGEVVAIYKANDGVTVKRLQQIGESWVGMSDNPSYPPIQIEEGDHIVGLVTTHHNQISKKR